MSLKRIVIAFALVLAVVATGGSAIGTVAASDAGTDQCTTHGNEVESTPESPSDAYISPMCTSGCVTYCPP